MHNTKPKLPQTKQPANPPQHTTTLTVTACPFLHSQQPPAEFAARDHWGYRWGTIAMVLGYKPTTVITPYN